MAEGAEGQGTNPPTPWFRLEAAEIDIAERAGFCRSAKDKIDVRRFATVAAMGLAEALGEEKQTDRTDSAGLASVGLHTEPIRQDPSKRATERRPPQVEGI